MSEFYINHTVTLDLSLQNDQIKVNFNRSLFIKYGRIMEIFL